MLLEKITDLKERLNRELESKELNDKEVLKISQELDKFISEYQKEKILIFK